VRTTSRPTLGDLGSRNRYGTGENAANVRDAFSVRAARPSTRTAGASRHVRAVRIGRQAASRHELAQPRPVVTEQANTRRTSGVRTARRTRYSPDPARSGRRKSRGPPDSRRTIRTIDPRDAAGRLSRDGRPAPAGPHAENRDQEGPAQAEEPEGPGHQRARSGVRQDHGPAHRRGLEAQRNPTIAPYVADRLTQGPQIGEQGKFIVHPTPASFETDYEKYIGKGGEKVPRGSTGNSRARGRSRSIATRSTFRRTRPSERRSTKPYTRCPRCRSQPTSPATRTSPSTSTKGSRRSSPSSS